MNAKTRTDLEAEFGSALSSAVDRAQEASKKEVEESKGAKGTEINQLGDRYKIEIRADVEAEEQFLDLFESKLEEHIKEQTQ